ncbi:MAG: hypothetical protein AAB421_04750 [Patescibacteria group bacterium]
MDGMMDRRRFLRAGTAAAATLLLKPLEALAQTQDLGKKSERGNLEYIREQGIEVFRSECAVGGVTVDLLEFRKNGSRNEVLFVPHDNEDAAFDTALRSIAARGGSLFSFDSRGNRELRTNTGTRLNQDPNRMFKPGSQFWPLAEHVLGLINQRRRASNDVLNPYITLHNNAPIGSFTASIAKSFTDPRFEIFFSDPKNKRDVVWIALPNAERGTSHPLRVLAQQLQMRGINALIEYVRPEGSLDGSLSQYIARHTSQGYINIEAGIKPNDPPQLQTRAIQTSLLKNIFEIIEELRANPPTKTQNT